MNCPNCGCKISEILPKPPGAMFRDAVYKRLEQYGFDERMSPEKHRFAVAVREIIKLRYGIKAKSGGAMSPEDAELGIQVLDVILPSRKESK